MYLFNRDSGTTKFSNLATGLLSLFNFSSLEAQETPTELPKVIPIVENLDVFDFSTLSSPNFRARVKNSSQLESLSLNITREDFKKLPLEGKYRVIDSVNKKDEKEVNKLIIILKKSGLFAEANNYKKLNIELRNYRQIHSSLSLEVGLKERLDEARYLYRILSSGFCKKVTEKLFDKCYKSRKENNGRDDKKVHRIKKNIERAIIRALASGRLDSKALGGKQEFLQNIHKLSFRTEIPDVLEGVSLRVIKNISDFVKLSIYPECSLKELMIEIPEALILLSSPIDHKKNSFSKIEEKVYGNVDRLKKKLYCYVQGVNLVSKKEFKKEIRRFLLNTDIEKTLKKLSVFNVGISRDPILNEQFKEWELAQEDKNDELLEKLYLKCLKYNQLLKTLKHSEVKFFTNYITQIHGALELDQGQKSNFLNCLKSLSVFYYNVEVNGLFESSFRDLPHIKKAIFFTKDNLSLEIKKAIKEKDINKLEAINSFLLELSEHINNIKNLKRHRIYETSDKLTISYISFSQKLDLKKKTSKLAKILISDKSLSEKKDSIKIARDKIYIPSLCMLSSLVTDLKEGCNNSNARAFALENKLITSLYKALRCGDIELTNTIAKKIESIVNDY